jgi:cytochrome c oxidase subunit 2
LTTGQKVLFDEDYARNSILNPQSQIVAGFDPVMPTYQGRLKDREISAIIEYIKTLQ